MPSRECPERILYGDRAITYNASLQAAELLCDVLLGEEFTIASLAITIMTGLSWLLRLVLRFAPSCSRCLGRACGQFAIVQHQYQRSEDGELLHSEESPRSCDKTARDVKEEIGAQKA